jgi:hypothetical protein
MRRAPAPGGGAGGNSRVIHPKFGFQAAAKACLAVLILLSISSYMELPAAAQDFRPHGSVTFEYEEDHDKSGDESTERSTFSQEYQVDLSGYIWRHEFLIFDSSFGYSDTMDDDSEQGESRDRNIDYYDITANVLPDLWMPLILEAKKNVVLLDSDESADSETEKDDYRVEWRLLNERIPEMIFEWERADDFAEEDGVDLPTTDTQRDTYRFSAEEAFLGRLLMSFEYEREEDRDNLQDTEDVRNTYVVSAAADISSNLRIDARAEYRTNELETATVINSLALREDVDSILGVTFYDATLPAFNSIDGHIAVPLTPGGVPNFSGWPVPLPPVTTVDDVNNNVVTFAAPIPIDVMVVIAYQTQDSTTYFDIYLGDDVADTYSLTVTQAVITEGFNDYLVFAEYISITDGLVTLNFAPLTIPEPIDSQPFPLTDVDVTIDYNTRSRNHFSDEFFDLDIEQSGNEFDLSRVNPGEDEERLFQIEISYLPIPPLDLNFEYEFNETTNEGETTTEQSVDVAMKYVFTDRLTNATDLSYKTDKTDFSFNPDADDPAAADAEEPKTEEWNYTTSFEYTRPTRWGILDLGYEYQFDTREEENTNLSEKVTHSVDADLAMARTKYSSQVEYQEKEDEDFTTGESTRDTEFSFGFEVENQQTFRGAGLTTTFGYDYELDKTDGEDDFTKNNYFLDEAIDFQRVTIDLSLEYLDEEQGDSWTEELGWDSEVRYDPFPWLDLGAGFDWTNTENEEDDSTNSGAFIEGDFYFDIGRSATLEFGARQEWTWDDPGEDERSFEFDAQVTYEIAEVRATFEFDYQVRRFNEDSEDTDDYGFRISLERDF